MSQTAPGNEPLVTDALIETLADVGRYADLPLASLTTLVIAGTPRAVQAGETILEEGKPSPSVFILVRGRLKMNRALANGRSVLLAIFNPGDPIGIAVLGGRESEATVTAIEPSVCLEIPNRNLLAAMSADPRLLADLLAVFTENVAECRNCVVEATFSRVEPRLAMLFLKLADSIGDADEHGTRIPVPLSRQEVADMTGTTIETSIRILSRWGKTGVVETREDGFLLRDRDALEKIRGS